MKKKINNFFGNILPIYIAVSIITRMSTYRYFNFVSLTENIILLFVLMVGVLVILCSKYSFSEYFLILILLLLATAPFVINRDIYLLVLVVLSLAFTQIASLLVVKKIFFLSLTSSIFVLFSFKLGFISQYIMYREGIPRYSLGFYHPNTLGVVFFILLAEYFFLKNGKLKIYNFLLSLGISFYIYYLTNSRTTLAITVFLILGICCVRYINKEKLKRFFSIFRFFPLIYLAATIWAVNNYPTNNLVYQVDKILSGRIYYGRLFLNIYDINSFGNPDLEIIGTKQVSESYGALKGMILDNSFLLVLVRYGIIPLLLLIALYTILIVFIHKQEKYYFLIILVAFLTLGISESLTFNYQYNVFLLFMFTPFFYNKDKIDTEKILI